MDQQYILNLTFVGVTFALYIGIAVWARASSTSEFYAAGRNINPVLNGMATAADWMSAASFISMAGLIAFVGYDNSTFLMGWTGGYVLLALLLAPYLRKFGKFTVPDFIGDRFYSQGARLVAILCLIVASVTYVIGQMTGVGVAFSRFLEVDKDVGLLIGAAVVFVYAVFGGMKGITYTQIAQYVVLITAYTIPAIFISIYLTGNPVPSLGLFSNHSDSGIPLLMKLDQVVTDLGFNSYTGHHSNTLNMWHHAFPIGGRPTALREAARRVFLGHAWRLHYPVQCHKGQHRKFAHAIAAHRPATVRRQPACRRPGSNHRPRPCLR